MPIYTAPCGGKVPQALAMYQIEVHDALSRNTLSARLPLLGVATMPHCRWTPEEFDEVAKLKVGENYLHYATGSRPVEIQIERMC